MSDVDYCRLSKMTWRLTEQECNGVRYVVSDYRFGRKLMHRVILPHYRMIDHRDRDGLNNTRGNLRQCTNSQNGANQAKTKLPTSSAFKGVCWSHQHLKWVAGIRFQGTRIHLGLHDDERVAAIAYNAASKVLFGRFARPNRIRRPTNGEVTFKWKEKE